VYRCSRCNQEFATARALGGHRSSCGSPLSGSVSLSVSGAHSLSEIASTQSLSKPLTQSLTRPEEIPVLRQAADAADRYITTGKRHNQINWPVLLVSIGIGALVTFLFYRTLQSWEWNKGPGKQISPYKLLGGLIGGLG